MEHAYYYLYFYIEMTFSKYHDSLFTFYISGNIFGENILLYMAYYGVNLD